MRDEKRSEVAEKPTEDTPSVEAVENVPSTEAEVTPSETYDKDKVAALISAAEASVQTVKDTQMADLKRAHQKELRDVTARQEEESLVRQEETEKTRFGETDPDLLAEMQTLRRRIHSTAVQTADIQAQGYAFKYGRQYGIDPEVLMECASPEEMQTKAIQKSQEVEKNAVIEKDGKIQTLEAKVAELEKTPQKIDSGVPAASGVSFANNTPEENIKYALEHPKK